MQDGSQSPEQAIIDHEDATEVPNSRAKSPIPRKQFTRRNLVHKFREALKNSMYDSKTGVRNDRWLDDRIDSAMKSAKRKNNSFFLLFMDIDNFKKFNSRFDHSGGDKILKLFASIGTRPGEEVARFGGEEFVQVLNDDIQESEAVRVASRNTHALESLSRNLVQALDIVNPNTEPIDHATLSFGIVEYQKGMTPEEIKSRASQAVLVAKNNGRDMIAVAKLDGSYDFYDRNAVAIQPSPKPPTELAGAA